MLEPRMKLECPVFWKGLKKYHMFSYHIFFLFCRWIFLVARLRKVTPLPFPLPPPPLMFVSSPGGTKHSCGNILYPVTLHNIKPWKDTPDFLLSLSCVPPHLECIGAVWLFLSFGFLFSFFQSPVSLFSLSAPPYLECIGTFSLSFSSLYYSFCPFSSPLHLPLHPPFLFYLFFFPLPYSLVFSPFLPPTLLYSLIFSSSFSPFSFPSSYLPFLLILCLNNFSSPLPPYLPSSLIFSFFTPFSFLPLFQHSLQLSSLPLLVSPTHLPQSAFLPPQTH